MLFWKLIDITRPEPESVIEYFPTVEAGHRRVKGYQPHVRPNMALIEVEVPTDKEGVRRLLRCITCGDEPNFKETGPAKRFTRRGGLISGTIGEL